MTSFDGLPPLLQGLQGPGSESRSIPASIRPEGTDGPGSERSGFVSALREAVESVDRLQDESAQKANALAAGEDVPLHDLLIAQERADVSFRLLIEVRNQLVDAWREVTRGPI